MLFLALGVCMIRDSGTVMLGQYFKRRRELVELFLTSSSGFGIPIVTYLILRCLR